MALKVVLQNASHVTDLGCLPPTYTSKILKAIKTAQHLHTLELNSDDIWDQTPEHWQRLINRDFPILAARHDYAPPDAKSWHLVYDRYKKLEDAAVADATAKLSQGLAAEKEHRDSRQSIIVSGAQARKLPRPRMVRRDLSLLPPCTVPSRLCARRSCLELVCSGRCSALFLILEEAE
jgi:elongin-A